MPASHWARVLYTSTLLCADALRGADTLLACAQGRESAMAQNHDLFDDLIDISKGLGALKDPLGGVTDALMGAASPDAPHWNPADYKERREPTPFRVWCASTTRARAPSAWMPARSRRSISRTAASRSWTPAVNAACAPRRAPRRRLCRRASNPRSSMMPSPPLPPRTRPLRYLHARPAPPAARKRGCARVRGDVTPEVWFSVLADYPNVSVYLPLDTAPTAATPPARRCWERPSPRQRNGAASAWALRLRPRTSGASSAASTSARSLWTTSCAPPVWPSPSSTPPRPPWHR